MRTDDGERRVDDTRRSREENSLVHRRDNHSRSSTDDALPTALPTVGSALRNARLLVILAVGTTIVLVGLLLLVFPGPAFVVLPTGLAILATEFVWARRLLRKAKDRVGAFAESLRRSEGKDQDSV